MTKCTTTTTDATSPVDADDEDAVAAHRLCVAPMMAWTDRHCRFLHRLVAPSARLYTEMLSTDALLHGDAERLLAFDRAEHPVAAQIGGSDPAELAKAARLVERAGFDEVNLNVGCPSARVQRGGIGACLMREPQRVADGVAAMRDAVTIPVTVKCRIGVTDTVAGEPSAGERPRREAAGRGIAPRMKEPSAGEREGLAPRMKEPSAGEREGPAPRKQEPSAGERPRREAAGRGIAPRKNAARDFGALRDFVGEVAQAGVRVFIVHARKAVLQGLSPAQNRCVPELRPELVERLARELPHLAVIVNGGIRDIETAHRYLGWAAGIMVGRKAYQDPVWLSRLDADLCGTTPKTAEQVFRAYLPYVDRRLGEGVPLRDMTRHMLTLFNGRPGARAYRRHLSTHQRNPHANVESLHAAVGFVRQSTRWPPAVAAA